MEQKMRKCPVCGGEAEVYSSFSCVYERIYGVVECKTCHIKKYGTKSFDTYDASYEGYDTPEWVENAHAEAKKSAIEAWNKMWSDVEARLKDGDK